MSINVKLYQIYSEYSTYVVFTDVHVDYQFILIQDIKH